MIYDIDYTLASYVLLRAALTPKYNIVVVGPSFRSTKIIAIYTEQIFDTQSVDVVNNSSGGLVRDVDTWTMNVGDSNIVFVSVDNTQKIKGVGADSIVVVDANIINQELITIILNDFANTGSVSYNLPQNITIFEKNQSTNV